MKMNSALETGRPKKTSMNIHQLNSMFTVIKVAIIDTIFDRFLYLIRTQAALNHLIAYCSIGSRLISCLMPLSFVL